MVEVKHKMKEIIYFSQLTDLIPERTTADRESRKVQQIVGELAWTRMLIC